MQAKAKHKQDDFHFKAGGGDGMDAFWHSALDQAASRLDDLAMEANPSGQPRWVWPFGVLLAQGQQVDAQVSQVIFHTVVVVGFVGIDFRTLRQLEIEPLQAGDIGAGTGRQEELNRLTLRRHQQMNLHAVEVAALTGGVTAGRLALIEPRAQDTVLVTGGHRKGVHDVQRLAVMRLPMLGQPRKQGQEVVLDPVQPSIQPAATQHRRDVALLLEQRPRPFDVASKVAHSHNRRRHDFGVTHLALAVLDVMHRVQQVVTHTVNGYDLGVHELLPGRWRDWRFSNH